MLSHGRFSSIHFQDKVKSFVHGLNGVVTVNIWTQWLEEWRRCYYLYKGLDLLQKHTEHSVSNIKPFRISVVKI